MTDAPAGAQPHEMLAYAARPQGSGPHFAVGRDAEHRYGVLYEGPWETEFDGTARAVRDNARALAAQGIPTLLSSRQRSVITREGVRVAAHEYDFPESFMAPLRPLTGARIAELSLSIRHTPLVHWETLHRMVVSERAEVTLRELPVDKMAQAVQGLYGSTILYTVFERDSIDDMLGKVLSRFREIWVPCHTCAEVLERHGVERVAVVPHCVSPDSQLPAMRGRGGSENGRAYYSIGKWEPRKGFDQLVLAFLRAFRPSDGARLTIKTSDVRWPHYPSPEEAVAAALEDRVVLLNGWRMDNLPLRIIIKQISEAEILRLHLTHDVYVSASHGEAWGLPAFDAVCAGRRLVHVPYGGTEEFSQTDSTRVPYHMAAVHPAYEWGDARWADYDVDHLADALWGTAGLSSVEPHLSSAEDIGRAMAHRLRAIAAHAAPEAAEAWRP